MITLEKTRCSAAVRWFPILCLLLCAASHAEPVTLTFSTGGNATAPSPALFPPAGGYLTLPGDTLLLQAVPAQGGSLLWENAAPLDNPRVAAVPVRGDVRVSVSADPAGPPSGQDGTAAHAVAPSGATHLFMASEGAYAWFAADRQADMQGAGISHLTSLDAPYYPVFQRPNLNFEHIINGAARDNFRATDTPRRDPMEITVDSPRSVRVRWPAATSSWALDCEMRYTLAEGAAVDMEFSVVPRKNEAPLGYIVFMWASYMHIAKGRALCFPGVKNGRRGWVRLGEDLPGGGFETGTVAHEGEAPLPVEKGAQSFNITTHDSLFFTEPFYYGKITGDVAEKGLEDTRAFIMMFDQAAPVRFALWNWDGKPESPAWDWQFVVRDPVVGQKYGYRARLLVKPFTNEEDVRAEYNAWAAAPDREASPPPVAGVSDRFPVILSPRERYYTDWMQYARRIEAAAPDTARKLLRFSLSVPELKLAALDEIIARRAAADGSAALPGEWRTLFLEGRLDPECAARFAGELARRGLAAETRAAAESLAGERPEYSERLKNALLSASESLAASGNAEAAEIFKHTADAPRREADGAANGNHNAAANPAAGAH